MPVDRLLVEGSLDAEVLFAICAGRPVVLDAGSKNSLAPVAHRERRERGTCTCYLRDRDFDHEPPTSQAQPIIDRTDSIEGTTLGWRWCRHEIENYMLDAGIVTVACGNSCNDYADALVKAARRIRHYEAARWAVGLARQGLPRSFTLHTKPNECKGEFELPCDMSERAALTWAVANVSEFVAQMQPHVRPESIQESFRSHVAKFSDQALVDPAFTVTWFSGKDLFGALSEWFVSKGLGGANGARNRIAGWMRENADKALHLLPEWQALLDALRS